MEGSPIQAYDIVMLAVLAITALMGAWKGFAWQVASLASLIVSAIVAIRMSGSLAPYITEEEWGRFAAMLILYLITSLAIWLLFRVIAQFIDRLKLKEFDHQVGGMFGLAKGILLCVVITFFAVTLSENARQAVLKTYSGRAVGYLIHSTLPLLPPEVHEKVGTYLEELDRKLDERTPTDASLPPLESTAPRVPKYFSRDGDDGS